MSTSENQKKNKNYKSYVKKHKEAPTGLGDKIEKITKKTEIKKVVDTVFDSMGLDCGCDKRKEKMNKIWPTNKPECFTEDEYELMKMAIDTKKNVFTGDEQKTFVLNRPLNCRPAIPALICQDSKKCQTVIIHSKLSLNFLP